MLEVFQFLESIFRSYGIFAFVGVVEAIIIVYLYRLTQKQQKEIVSLYEKQQKEIVSLYEKRVEDVSESKDDYEELAHKLDQQVDLLIKVFKRNGG